MSLRRSIIQKGIRLIAGGANQKTTQGMIRGAGSTSKGGVETMGSMGTIPKIPKPPTVSYGTLPKTVKTPPISSAMKTYIEGFKTANKANKTIKDVDKFMSTSKNFAPKTKVNMSDIVSSNAIKRPPVPKKAQPKKK